MMDLFVNAVNPMLAKYSHSFSIAVAVTAFQTTLICCFAARYRFMEGSMDTGLHDARDLNDMWNDPDTYICSTRETNDDAYEDRKLWLQDYPSDARTDTLYWSASSNKLKLTYDFSLPATGDNLQGDFEDDRWLQVFASLAFNVSCDLSSKRVSPETCSHLGSERRRRREGGGSRFLYADSSAAAEAQAKWLGALLEKASKMYNWEDWAPSDVGVVEVTQDASWQRWSHKCPDGDLIQTRYADTLGEGKETCSKLEHCRYISCQDQRDDPVVVHPHAWECSMFRNCSGNVSLSYGNYRLRSPARAWAIAWSDRGLRNLRALREKFSEPGFSWPCHTHGRSCSEYSCRGRQAVVCSDDVLCSGDVVTIKKVKDLPWKQCFPLALAWVAYFEVSATMFVLCFFLCVTKGPCWMWQRGTKREILRVSAHELVGGSHTASTPTVCELQHMNNTARTG